MAEAFSINDIEEDSQEESLMQLVGFVIAKERFGVDILMVQEILRSTEVTQVPNSPEFMEGVINLRGSIIPVVDLRKRLNLYKENESKEGSWVLILNINNKVVGFVVDHVTEVIKVEEDSVEAAPEIIVSGLECQYIQGVCEIDNRLIIILDFDLVLFNEEQKILEEIDGLGDDDEVMLTEAAIVPNNERSK